MADRSLLLALRASSAAVALGMAITAIPAFAQSAPTGTGQDAPPTMAPTGNADATVAAQATDASQTGDGEIIVTGSRLGRAGYDAPTPVNVVGQQRLQQLNISNVADALNQIPSFRPINSPAANSFRVSGNIASRVLDLRGLGATRTLTLVDGRRFVPSSDAATVDINSIPSVLVQRTEVVTGGASAAYGANAVSGVVNLIFDTKLTGIKAEVNYGISQRGDAKQFYASIGGGTDYADGRGHIIFGAEYQEEGGVGPCEQRSWCSKYTNYVPNPGYNTTTRTSTNGLPATLVLDHVMFVYNENGILTGAVKPGATAGSTVTLGQQVLNTGASALPAALRGKQFDVNGNLVPYQFGDYLSGAFQVLPNGDPTQPYLLGLSPTPLVVPVRHHAGMVRTDYELTDDITVTAEALYSRVVGGRTASTPPLDTPAAIRLDNPYLSAATVAAVRAADPTITTLNVNHSAYAVGEGLVLARSINDTYRAALSFKGKFGDSGWNWDAYYTYGRVDGKVDAPNVRLKTWNDAVDAVTVTAANRGTSGLAVGSIVCRTTLTNPTNGCIPLNLFGYRDLTPAQRAYYFATETQDRTYRQHVAAANLRGTPFSTWAGDVRVAVGAEYRRDIAGGSADLNTIRGAYIAANTTVLPFTTTKVFEAYAEGSVPLLKDSSLGQALDIDGAVRRTHYNSFGNATTWKVGGVYTPIQDVTFRVTRSRDIRAPTPAEASPNATTVQLPLADPFTGQITQQFIVTGGNPNLHLEKGDTFTAGVVLKPSFVPRFNMSVDYYNIKVKGAIDSLTGSAIATACRSQNLLCNLIQFNANGSINTIFSNFQNLSRLHAEGFEMVADYRLPAFGGNLDFQVNGNYVVDLSTIGATGLVTQLDNVTGNFGSVTNIQGVPRWKADAVVTYSTDQFAVTAHGRYVPSGYLDSTKIGPEEAGYTINDPNSISTNRIDGAFYLDLSGRIKIADGRFELFGNVNNVFDKKMPKQLRFFGNALHFDSVGRYFKAGVRAKF